MRQHIDFKVMGLDDVTSELLNWCMQNHDNLLFLKETNFMESQSMEVHCFFNDERAIMKTEKPQVYKRA